MFEFQMHHISLEWHMYLYYVHAITVVNCGTSVSLIQQRCTVVCTLPIKQESISVDRRIYGLALSSRRLLQIETKWRILFAILSTYVLSICFLFEPVVYNIDQRYLSQPTRYNSNWKQLFRIFQGEKRYFE